MQLKQGNISKMKDLKILKEKENLLFKRKEIQAVINSEITPSYANMAKLISEKFSIPEENIKIKKIKGKFGSSDFNIEMNIYASEKDKDDTEMKSKKESKTEKAAEPIK